MQRKIFFNNGFTLIETMVVASILLLLMIVGSEYIIHGFRSITFESEQQTAIQNARKAVDIIGREIRETRSSARGDYALASTTAQNLVFYGDNDNDGLVEKIRFYLNTSNNKLIETKTEPGIANDYTGTTTTLTAAEYVNNGAEAIFKYFDANNNETSLINNIRLINIRLKINVNPSIAPQDYYVETDTNLRNLKDNL